jgi:hypothetical protein
MRMKLGKGITIESALTFPTGTKKHLEDCFSLHPVEAFLAGICSRRGSQVFSYKDNGWRFILFLQSMLQISIISKLFTLYLSRLWCMLASYRDLLLFRHRRVYRDFEAGGCDCVDSDYSLRFMSEFVRERSRQRVKYPLDDPSSIPF